MKKAIEIMASGGIIAHPTDTCYGFACDIFNEKALKKLYRLKKMSQNKPVSVIVSGLVMAKKYGIFNRETEVFAKKYWPGPLTIIVKKKKSLPGFLNPKIKTIGFRVPKHNFSLQLVKKFGSPITTTSANISGNKPAYSSSEIKKQFAKLKYKPDLILSSGRIKINPPSTIIDFSSDKPKILRRG